MGLLDRKYLPTPAQSAARDIRLDQVSIVDTTSESSVIYDGVAPVGSDPADEVWNILKTDTNATITNNDVVSVWANNVAWDDRLTADYDDGDYIV